MTGRASAGLMWDWDTGTTEGWVGHDGDGRDSVAICNAGIQAVVQLAAEEPSLTLPRDRLIFRVPLHDGSENEPENLWLAVTACAIAITEQMPPEACLARVGACHQTDVSPALWRDLRIAIARRVERV